MNKRPDVGPIFNSGPKSACSKPLGSLGRVGCLLQIGGSHSLADLSRHSECRAWEM